MAMPETTTIVENAVDTTKAISILSHIVERRLEYLIGTLVAHQLGLIDQVIMYGSGMC